MTVAAPWPFRISPKSELVRHASEMGSATIGISWPVGRNDWPDETSASCTNEIGPDVVEPTSQSQFEYVINDPPSGRVLPAGR